MEDRLPLTIRPVSTTTRTVVTGQHHDECASAIESDLSGLTMLVPTVYEILMCINKLYILKFPDMYAGNKNQQKTKYIGYYSYVLVNVRTGNFSGEKTF